MSIQWHQVEIEKRKMGKIKRKEFEFSCTRMKNSIVRSRDSRFNNRVDNLA